MKNGLINLLIGAGVLFILTLMTDRIVSELALTKFTQDNSLMISMLLSAVVIGVFVYVSKLIFGEN